MKQAHSTKWKASVQPRKQRKYLHNLPYHRQGSQLSVHLSPALREKHKTRALRVRKGDKVRVLRGTHRGKEGIVDHVDVRNARIHVSKVEHAKREGGTAPYPLRPSNCMLIQLVEDKRRFAKKEEKK
ncbi:50S ribosomal protein L24 [Candidatus Woesearchaeota archaeon]|nr:MAG: 50S ribosomal protein L24 [Candidatus Woesearchaeota archaeon]